MGLGIGIFGLVLGRRRRERRRGGKYVFLITRSMHRIRVSIRKLHWLLAPRRGGGFGLERPTPGNALLLPLWQLEGKPFAHRCRKKEKSRFSLGVSNELCTGSHSHSQ
jgi:hypothetical protein